MTLNDIHNCHELMSQPGKDGSNDENLSEHYVKNNLGVHTEYN